MIVVRCYTPAVSRQLVFVSAYGILLMSLIEDGLVCTNCVGGSHANIAGCHAQSRKQTSGVKLSNILGAVVDSFIYSQVG